MPPPPGPAAFWPPPTCIPSCFPLHRYSQLSCDHIFVLHTLPLCLLALTCTPHIFAPGTDWIVAQWPSHTQRERGLPTPHFQGEEVWNQSLEGETGLPDRKGLVKAGVVVRNSLWLEEVDSSVLRQRVRFRIKNLTHPFPPVLASVGKFYCKPHYCYRLSGYAQRKRPAVAPLSGKVWPSTLVWLQVRAGPAV